MPRPLRPGRPARADPSTRSPGRAACVLARTARRAGRSRAPAAYNAPRTSSRWPRQRLLDARCMLLLLPPPRGPSASGECPHELLIVSGLSPSTKRNQAFGPPRGLCPSHGAMRTPLALPRVHPLTTYSPEIALRLAYVRKIHLYFSTHRSLSARCDLSRVSCIPPRACAATSHVYRSQRSPWTACSSSMTTCMPLRPLMST
jgi:hypothetical protein